VERALDHGMRSTDAEDAEACEKVQIATPLVVE
jgi:hypothetical protein